MSQQGTEEQPAQAHQPEEQQEQAISSDRKRSVEDVTSEHLLLSSSPPTKIQKVDKAYKGLRQFSMMVCKKVEEKGSTTYNEVADELVQEIFEERRRDAEVAAETKFDDQKNIRRRVYDALNVLMAMDIIAKDRKNITWKGLPTSAAQDLEMLNRELLFRSAEVKRKREALKELVTQQVCFKNLVEHNMRRMGAGQGRDAKSNNKIPLPFLVINTDKNAIIQCKMSPDLTEVQFDFSMPFEINDDNTILKRLGLHRTSEEDLKKFIPKDVLEYSMKHKLLDQILKSDNTATPASVPSSS